MTNLERAIAALEAIHRGRPRRLCGADRITLWQLLKRWDRMLAATAPRRQDDGASGSIRTRGGQRAKGRDLAYSRASAMGIAAHERRNHRQPIGMRSVTLGNTVLPCACPFSLTFYLSGLHTEAYPGIHAGAREMEHHHATKAEVEAEQHAYERGRRGLKDLKREAKRDKSFAAWLDISDAFGAAQAETFRVTGSNNNQGAEYSREFSHVLDREGLNDVEWVNNKPTRAALLELHTFRGQIIEWRNTLKPARKAAQNNPRTVVNNWKASFAPSRKPDPPHPDEVRDEDVGNGDLAGLADDKRQKATDATNAALRRELADAKGMIAALKTEVARLQELLTPSEA